MIDLEDKEDCKCKKVDNSQPECKNQYTISEKGKSVSLIPKSSQEKVLALVIDQCVIKDNQTKCDALFLFHSNSKKISFLTELKGAGDIPKAFYQLSYTKNNRKAYKDIIQNFTDIDNKRVIEKFIIVSNGQINKKEWEKLENQNRIRVSQILHSEPTTPIPDLRDYL
jgi:hypothetical protein